MKIDGGRKVWMKRSILYRKYAMAAASVVCGLVLYEAKYNIDPDDEEANLPNQTYLMPVILNKVRMPFLVKSSATEIRAGGSGLLVEDSPARRDRYHRLHDP